MPVEISEMPPGNATGKARLLCLSDLDKRTTAFRRTELLINRIERDLGGGDRLSEAQRQIVRAAALTGAMREDIGAKWLSGEAVDPVQYCTLANAERRLYETVGLSRVAREVPDLKQYLEAKGSGTNAEATP